MRLIAGAQPWRVYASGGQNVNHLDESYQGEVPDILDNAYVIVDFEGGCRALLDLCMFAEASANEQEIAATGDRGKVELRVPARGRPRATRPSLAFGSLRALRACCFVPESSLRIGRREGRKVEILQVPVQARLLEAGFHHGATFHEHAAFLRAVRQGTPPEVSVEDGLAAERSVREGRPLTGAELGL